MEKEWSGVHARARDLLLEARKLIAEEACWIKDDYAHDAQGACVSLRSKEAVAFSLKGAILRQRRGVPVAVRLAVRKVIGMMSMGEFNDDPATTHGDALAMLDLAMEVLERGEDLLGFSRKSR